MAPQCEAETTVGYFGYGSLVNRQTLRTDYVDAIPVRLSGWRRHWQTRARLKPAVENTRFDNVALLSVHRSVDCVLDGLLIIDKKSNLQAVDEREFLYCRHKIFPDEITAMDASAKERLPEELYIYVAMQNEKEEAAPALLQTYLDAVLHGYLTEFGEMGLAGFLNTTVGFDRPMITDRSNPIYPRSVKLDVELHTKFDQLLKEAGVQY